MLWNLYFDYSFADDQWDASFAIDNLFNKDAVVSRFTNQFSGETTQSYAPPRQFTVPDGVQVLNRTDLRRARGLYCGHHA